MTGLLKIRTLLVILTLISAFFAGCEKIIDIDLNYVNPAIVIEGNLSLNDSTIEVLISETGSYFEDRELKKISGANVYLEDNEGNIFEVDEKEQGLYLNDQVNVRAGSNYKLTVTYNSREYSAVSCLNPPVSIDSAGYERVERTRFYEGGYRVNIFFEDPPGVENYYRIKVYKNGELLSTANDLIVFDDSGIDGKLVQVRLRGQRFNTHDRAFLEMLTIDKPVWRYFSTQRDVININPGSPAPANPVSNFNNGALGYFSAWSYDTKFIIIK